MRSFGLYVLRLVGHGMVLHEEPFHRAQEGPAILKHRDFGSFDIDFQHINGLLEVVPQANGLDFYRFPAGGGGGVRLTRRGAAQCPAPTACQVEPDHV